MENSIDSRQRTLNCSVNWDVLCTRLEFPRQLCELRYCGIPNGVHYDFGYMVLRGSSKSARSPKFELTADDELAVLTIVLLLIYANDLKSLLSRMTIFYVIMSFPYFVWRLYPVTYAFYYFDGVLHSTPYFNNPVTHAWSIFVWVAVALLAIVILQTEENRNAKQ